MNLLCEALRVKIKQSKACYSSPLSVKGIETYPLPPYSTVLGMIYTAIGRKRVNDDEIDISIQGNFSSIYRDYWSAVKYGDDGFMKKPIEVPTLHNIELILHIKSNKLDEIEKALKAPKVYLSLGRGEDLTRITEIKRVKLKEKNLDDIYAKPIISSYSAYVPIEIATTCGLVGVFYRLNFIYELKDGYRFFNRTKDVFYVESPIIVEKGKIWVDNHKEGREEYPVWFL